MKNSIFLKIFYVIIIATLVTLFKVFGAFTVLNEWSYDIFESFTLKSETRTKVLFVEAPQETREQGDKTWLTLLSKLKKENAKQVVFTFMPKGVSKDFYCRAKQYGNVFFARSLQHEPQQNLPKLEPLPKLPADCEINFGLVDIPPQTYGIHSTQYSAFQIDQHSYKALEVVAAEHFIGQPIEFTTDYRVNFGNWQERLPRIELDKVLSGGLVTDLVEQRSVIVGLAHPSDVPSLHIPPTITHDITISMPEYQTLALNTLLNKGNITTFDAKATFLLLLVITVISVLFYSWLSVWRSWVITAFLICVYIVVPWLLYHYFNILLPLLEMMIAQAFGYWFTFHKQVMATNTQLRETLLDNTFKLENRLKSEHFTDDKYWSQLIGMVNDILSLNRQIILEWKTTEKRVEEVKALNCSLADIQLSDYKKEPYTTAIRMKSALKLKQALLKQVDTTEEQYLVPLIFGDDLVGFWLLAFEPSKRYYHDIIDKWINYFANQIGESLYHMQEWRLRSQADKSLLQFESNEFLYKTLDKSIIALGHRFSVLENIIDDLETATILYDVFGMASLVNKKMHNLSHMFRLTDHHMSALDLMVKLLDIDTEFAQQYFRNLMLEEEKIVKQVTLSYASVERIFVLSLQSFSYKEIIGGNESNIKQGILCQLVDISKMKFLSTLKEQVAERLIFQFRNDMQSILTASKLITREGATDKERRMVANILHNKVNKHIEILQEVETQLNVQIDASDKSTVETYPINAKESVLNAISSLAQVAVERQLEWYNELPDLESLVYADPEGLMLLVRSMLDMLIEDANPNTRISIKILEQQDNWITYTLKNTGSGVPNERFQKYLFSDEENIRPSLILDEDKDLEIDLEVEVSDKFEISDKYKSFHSAIGMVNKWGGTIRAESHVGQGMFFELRLRGFI